MPRSARASRLAALAAGLATGVAACSGDGGTAPPPAPTTGALVISATGLPAGLTASFQLVAPDGAQRTVAAGDTARNLKAGTVVVRPASPRAPAIGRWIPAFETYDATVVAGQTASQEVAFLAAPILLQVTSSGLPSGTIAPVRFTGPDGTAFNTTAGVPFMAPSPGAWTLAGLTLLANDYGWAPVSPPVTRTLLPGDTAAVVVDYAATTGAVRVTTPDLDTTFAPRFTLRSGATTLTRTGVGTFTNLAPGTWELSAAAFAITGFRFTPAVATQLLTVTAGSTAGAAVAYSSAPVPTNLSVEGAYLTQAVQTFDGLTPLVAGRDALLRVFLRAISQNDWRPPVRATLYNGTTVLRVFDIPAAATGVDTIIDEGSRQRTWNVRVPGALVVPGLRLLVEADPARTITADGDPDDNIWPRGGAPRPIDVRALAPWRAVLVPIVNNDRTGNVTAANASQFTSAVRRLLPMQEVDIRVRESYTANAAPLQSNDTNGGWLALLAELNALRAADRAGPEEYYYGVVSVSYTSGIAGYGYVPGRAAVGWDYLPSGNLVAAHEWGHNVGRRHTPCGISSGADPLYPDASGAIGSWGWNPDTDQLVAPTAYDFMGYCGNQWVSAFTWGGAMQYRSGTPNAIVARADGADVAAAAAGGLLVWGSVREGRVALEPAFHVPDHVAVPHSAPAADVTLRVEALDADGRVLASALAPASRVDHADGDTRQFAVMLPLTSAQHERLAQVRARDVRSPLVAATRRRDAVTGAQAGRSRALGGDASLRRLARGAEVLWDDPRVAGALVRDAASGRVLSILRAPAGRVTLPGGSVEVIFSDGVRSEPRRLNAR